MKYWEIIAEHLSKTVGALSQRLIPTGERFWIAEAHRDDGKRFVVHADEKLSAVPGIGIDDSCGRMPRGLRSA